MATPNIDVINDSTCVSDADVNKVVEVLQVQATRDWAPIWGLGANIRWLPKTAKPEAGAWVLAVLDDSDQADALGYHEVADNGMPLGKVFARSDMNYGLFWSVTASHELLEMLGDPGTNTFVTGPDGKVYAREVCDPVEDDQYSYMIGDVRVSDFVYPSYYSGYASGPDEHFDKGGYLTAPVPQMLSGGYNQVWAPNQGWTQIFGEEVPHDRGRLPRGFHRRKLRAKPREIWRPSTRFQS